MKIFLLSFFTFLFSMLIVDAVWLGVMANRFYANQIGHLMASTPKLLPAAVFYLIFALALTILVLGPSIQNNLGLTEVLFKGMIFGLVTYATYDLTNHATLKDWPLIVTVVDMIWGAVLTGTLSVSTVWFVRYIQAPV